MKKAIIFLESQQGQLKKSSLELLSLFKNEDWEIHGVSLGENVENLKDQLSQWGVSHFHIAQQENLNNYNPEAYRQVLASTFESVQPNLVLASSNTLGRDMFPRLAARFDYSYMSDITEISLDSELVARRPLYAGKCTAQVSFTDESNKILLVRPNQIAVASPSKNSNVEVHKVELTALSGKMNLQSVEKSTSEKADLTEAETIVSGGRGLKDAESFKILEGLAAPLNATVGASRAVVDLGWVPHSMQVGQTGKTVTPTLYFAIGISGAIQHLAGMSGSKVIVAINKDEKAPIFQKATYGLVGDLFEIVPILSEKLAALKN